MDQKELGFAAVDTGRERRQGFAEVIYGAGKTAEQIIEILKILLAESEGNVMATRVDREKALTVLAALPEVRYDEVSRILCVERKPPVEDAAHRILVVTAGTSDIPVAEEAALTARLMGNDVKTLYDVGVAGIHRLLAHKEELLAANVVIVVAGMEGAPCHRRADERGLRCVVPWLDSASFHAQFVRDGRRRREHRQWLRGGRDGEPHQ